MTQLMYFWGASGVCIYCNYENMNITLNVKDLMFNHTIAENYININNMGSLFEYHELNITVSVIGFDPLPPDHNDHLIIPQN